MARCRPGPKAGASELRLASFQPTLILFPGFSLSDMTLNAPLTVVRIQRFQSSTVCMIIAPERVITHMVVPFCSCPRILYTSLCWLSVASPPPSRLRPPVLGLLHIPTSVVSSTRLLVLRRSCWCASSASSAPRSALLHTLLSRNFPIASRLHVM